MQSKINFQPSIGGIVIFVISFIILCLWGCPQYQVYSAKLHGESELKRATYNRQIKVQEAEATKNAASDLAAADTIRAHGMAQANKIIGNSLKNNPLYLQYMWIEMLKESKGHTIYVPNNGSLPITESTRLLLTQNDSL